MIVTPGIAGDQDRIFRGQQFVGERGDEQVGRLDVDGEDLVDLVGRGVSGRAEGENAAGVDEDVDVAAAGLDGWLMQRLFGR